MKNYYAILGVIPQAEDIVIKAAYRALAQRYHPDRRSTPDEEANLRMSEINEAYAVLSSPERRAAYDRDLQLDFERKDGIDEGDAAANEGLIQINQDWETAVDYYPDLSTLEHKLSKTSKSLAFTFKLYLILEKDFINRLSIANAMHEAFLSRYFGNRTEVLTFAKLLIDLGRRDAAKALNEAVRVLGKDVDPTLVIERICSRFDIEEEIARQENPHAPYVPKGMIFAGYQGDNVAALTAKAARTGASVMDVREAVLALRGNVEFRGEGCLIKLHDTIKNFPNAKDSIVWYREELYPKLHFAAR